MLWYQNHSNYNNQSEQRNITKNQWEPKIKISKLPEARENASDPVAFDILFRILLVERMAWVFWANHIANKVNSKVIQDYLPHSIRNCFNSQPSTLSCSLRLSRNRVPCEIWRSEVRNLTEDSDLSTKRTYLFIRRQRAHSSNHSYSL